jgi:hypothetical protein
MFELQENEHIIRIIHRNWIIFVIKNVFTIFFSFMCLFITFIPLAFGGNAYKTLSFFSGIIGLVALIKLFVDWTKYHLDLWVVTNHRIIDVVQTSLFNRKTSNARLDDLKDITVVVDGFWATYLNFGSLDIKILGNPDGMRIEDVTDPENEKHFLYKQAQLLEKEKVGELDPSSYKDLEDETLHAETGEEDNLLNIFFKNEGEPLSKQGEKKG